MRHHYTTVSKDLTDEGNKVIFQDPIVHSYIQKILFFISSDEWAYRNFTSRLIVSPILEKSIIILVSQTTFIFESQFL